ncbi:MAG: hypothetical protein J6K16_04410 [Alphaproteobacteria bacterium]|nr:hypothetical protein [Alphaproteobacteria bacterium]
MPHYKEEWRKKATIDYYSHFLALWVGFNSWYKEMYTEYEYKSSKGKTVKNKKDCHYIEIIQTVFSNPTNELYDKFENLLYTSSKQADAFRTDLTGLYFALNSCTSLFYEETRREEQVKVNITFEYVKIPSNKKAINLFEITLDNEEDSEYAEFDQKITIAEREITVSDEDFFAAIIEILYKTRCCLVHGTMNPEDDENHEVVKYCYNILLALIG